jgi:riboflavin synthase
VFTGLVQDLGRVSGIERSPDGVVLTVATKLAADIKLGDSIATNGVCLTAVSVSDGAFATEVMNESLRLTALNEIPVGAAVNLELAMRPADRFGGHIVQGHVDGVGTVSALAEDGFARRVTVDAPPEVLRYVVHKGSITVSGVSLTVAELTQRSFTVSLIPETLERTTLGAAAIGDAVNLEVDVLAKYVERLTQEQLIQR